DPARYTPADPGEIRIWSAEDGEPVCPAIATPSPVEQAVFSPDATRLLALLLNSRPFACDPSTGRNLTESLHARLHEPVDHFRFSPDGSRVLALRHNSRGETLDVVEPWTNSHLASYQFDGRADNAFFTPDGQGVVFCQRYLDYRRGEI